VVSESCCRIAGSEQQFADQMIGVKTGSPRAYSGRANWPVEVLTGHSGSQAERLVFAERRQMAGKVSVVTTSSNCFYRSIVTELSTR
ncbi:hypothetical protein, partial [Variovorax boronicumulans]|uniref:hypothetical protein n=1 Tax=Variovorax boronicumulans TaxID=436515 RepID=UPI0027D89261